jgi:pyruvate,orthophosphate dikinase
MQRADFLEIFEIMRGRPVTIRLLDPPLHEFLPSDPAELAEFAEAMGLPLADVAARAQELAEVNPMLGMRGVRLGVVMPAIYDMQARAIFEAAIAVNRDARAPVVPEVMIPLVSANREVELVKARVDAIAAEVQREQGAVLTSRLGVMVETPRAALRAGDIAASAAILSFGTNDHTQMTYGLSRDDAGRFMRDYMPHVKIANYVDDGGKVTKGIDCEVCHGDQKTVGVARQYQNLTMGWCINCHRDQNERQFKLGMAVRAPVNACDACHR